MTEKRERLLVVSSDCLNCQEPRCLNCKIDLIIIGLPNPKEKTLVQIHHKKNTDSDQSISENRE